MTNLLQETTDIMKEHGKTFDDVEWIGSKDGYIEIEDFIRLADVEYDRGFGAAEVAVDLIIIGKDFYLTRGEYDGSEWWEYHSMELFHKPKNELKVNSVVGRLWVTLRELGEYYDE